MKELIEQVKKLSTEVTYLRNQNNQLQNIQRSNQGQQVNNQNFQGNNNQGFQRRTWNMAPNNGNVVMPLDNPSNSQNQENYPTSKVFLVEVALSSWCRLHNMNQHSEL